MTARGRRRRIVVALDWLAAAFVLGALAIHLTGGISMRLDEVRLSARRDERGLMLAIAVVAIRLLLDRREGAFGTPGEVWRQRLSQFRSQFGSNREGTFGAAPGVPRRVVLVSLALSAIGAVLLRDQIRHMESVPDLGDPLLSMWRLAWVWHQVRADPRHLFDANIFHPERLTLTYSDSTLLPAMTAAPLFATGLHPVVVYNIVFLSGFLLSGVAMYVLVERLTGCARSAFVSAVLFAFYTFRFEHYSHLELQLTQWMPVTLLMLHRLIDTGRVRYAIAVAVAWAAQFYSSMYFGVFLAVYAVIVSAMWIGLRGAALRPLAAPLAGSAVMSLLFAIPLARVYSSSAALVVVRNPGAVSQFSATPADYLRVHERSALYSGRLPASENPERALFPGIVPIVLASAALAPPLSAVSVTYAVAMIVAFDGSLGFEGWVHPFLYDWLPPVRRMRAPARFSMLVGLSLALLAGIGTRRLLQRFAVPPWRQHVAFTFILIAAIVESQPVLRLQPVWPEAPPIYASLSSPGVVLAEFPVPRTVEAFVENTPFMYFSLWHWARMVNGYAGLMPPRYIEFVDRVREFPSPPAVEFLRRRGVSHVTVNCALFTTPCEPLVERIEQTGAFRPVAHAIWERYPVHLYELIR